MDRRDTIFALLVLGGIPRFAGAQSIPKLFRVGILSDSIPPAQLVPFLAAKMRELGYEEGRDIIFEYRFAEGDEARLPGLAAELVAKKVDLIVALMNPEILAAKQATSTIPIVMFYAGSPVESGFVASLAHPGGNITGTAVEDPEVAGKKLEILRDTVPGVKRVAILWEPEYPGFVAYMLATEAAAKAMEIRMIKFPGRNLAEIEHSLALIAKQRPDGLYVVPTGSILANQARIVEFARRQRLPAIYMSKESVIAGGLMSYGTDIKALHVRSIAIIDRILKGARPEDVPVEQPTKYELVINLKAAKAIGLKIPQMLLLRANKLIE